jgi:MarR family transcriptional regulator, organic hydroperoxide resistance regulator
LYVQASKEEILPKKEEQFKYCLYFATNNLSRRINELADEAFSITGFSPSLAFLLMLVNDEPGITPTGLSDKLSLAVSTITRFVDKLENKGFVKRETEGKNCFIYPAEKGINQEALLEKAWNNLYEMFREIFDKEDYESLTEKIYGMYRKIKEKNQTSVKDGK